MIIIGEKINGFIPKTLEAIKTRDAHYIKELAQLQEKCGAQYLDVCAGTAPEEEQETMEWLIGIVEEVSDLPLCLDSSDPQVLLECMSLVKKPGMFNSVSLEAGKCEALLPAIASTAWRVVALTCDENGIPSNPEQKFSLAAKLIEEIGKNDIPDEQIFIDPLVTTLATQGDSFINFIEAVKLIKAEFPQVHITSGLSNISFGLPYRKGLNMQFLSLAMEHGMDSAIMDPTDAAMLGSLYASNALLGKDEYCMEYLSAYREGLFPVKPA